MKLVLYLFLLTCSIQLLKAQEFQKNIDAPKDSNTILKKKKLFKEGHNPSKAAFLSAILPGAGQVYNKKYWKLPIIYVGISALIGTLAYSSTEWKGYTNAYRLEIDDDPTTIGTYKGFSEASQLLIKRRQFKRTIDVSAIALTAFYLLQIVDATVDAHLLDFDVNDDISISLLPDFQYQRSTGVKQSFYAGLNLQLKLKK